MPPLSAGQHVDFGSYFDPQIPCVILKTFLRELPEPLLTFDLYEPVMVLQGRMLCAWEVYQISNIQDIVL